MLLKLTFILGVLLASNAHALSDSMKKYTFCSFNEIKTDRGNQLFPGENIEYEFSDRLSLILDNFYSKYKKSFPDKGTPKICLKFQEWHGASGEWAGSGNLYEPPIFTIRISDTYDNYLLAEATLAHEIAHAIIRIEGVPGSKAIPPRDLMISNQYNSLIDHPYVYHILRKAGYDDEQKINARSIIAQELKRLEVEDFKGINFTTTAGNIYLASWYFDFYHLAPKEYAQLKLLTKGKVKGIYEKLIIIEECWRESKLSIKTDYFRRTLQFQSCTFQKLGLEGNIKLTTFDEWQIFLFGSIPDR